MITFNFDLSFEENTANLVVSTKTKGKIMKFSDNYYVLKSFFDGNHHDNYTNKCIRPNGIPINNTAQRCWDLANKFKIEDIHSEWVTDNKEGRRGFKRYWLNRGKS